MNLLAGMKRDREIFSIALITFFIAGGGILYEVYLGAFGSYIFGDSVKVFSLVTGVYMFCMGLGAFAIPSTLKQPFQRVLLIELVLMTIHVVSPFLIWWAFISGFGTNIWFWGLLAVSGTLVGTEIPLLLGLVREQQGSSDSAVNSILAFDYLGALAASLMFGFYLLPKIGLIGSAAFAALAEGVGTFALILLRRKAVAALSAAYKAVIAALFLVFVITCGVFFNAHQLQTFLEETWIEKSFPQGQLEHSEYTGFSHVSLVSYTQRATGKRTHELLLDRQYQWSTGTSMDYYHDLLTIPVVEAFQMRTGKTPQKVLIIGGGDGFAADRLHRYYGIEDITIVDIDPRISKLALEKPYWRDAGGSIIENKAVLDLRNEDAFTYIIRRQLDTSNFDIVIFDLPDPRSTAITRFFTPFFFKHLKAYLHENTHISIQSSTEARSKFGTIKYVCNLQSVLRSVDYFSEVALGVSLDTFIIASPGAPPIMPVVERELPGSYVTSTEHIRSYVQDPYQWFGSNCQKLAVNQMLTPTLLDF